LFSFLNKLFFSFALDDSIEFFIGNENPEDWESSMINDEESLFLSFDEERLNGDGIERDF